MTGQAPDAPAVPQMTDIISALGEQLMPLTLTGLLMLVLFVAVRRITMELLTPVMQRWCARRLSAGTSSRSEMTGSDGTPPGRPTSP